MIAYLIISRFNLWEFVKSVVKYSLKQKKGLTMPNLIILLYKLITMRLLSRYFEIPPHKDS